VADSLQTSRAVPFPEGSRPKLLKKHPSTMGAQEIATFLSWLATGRRVSASTQNQALSALLFLYRHVNIEGTMWMAVALLYGDGLRLQECLELRVKGLAFDRREIVVRRGKGQKGRRTMLPVATEERFQGHLREGRRQHERDLADGVGRVVLPFALDRKYPIPVSNRFTPWRLARLSAWPFFSVRRSRSQRTTQSAARPAGTVARVGCKRRLAVYSVRSWVASISDGCGG